MEVFKQALKLEPSRVETICSYVRESRLYIQSTHPATGLSNVQEMLYWFQGQTLVQLGREEKAAEVLSEATRMHPKAGCLHLALANSFAQQKALNKVYKVIFLFLVLQVT